MSTAQITRSTTEASRTRAKYVGVYYLMTIATGAFILFFHGGAAFMLDLVVGVFFITVTVFFYGWSKAANRR